MKRLFIIILLGLSTLAYAINPDREYEWTPDKRGLAYTEYQLETSDKYSINVWEYGLPDSGISDKTVILVGTDAGNMSDLIWKAYAFINKGVRVISFDYRGFGKSADFEMNKDMLFYTEFAKDLDTVIKATREKYPTDKIGLYALSMGTHVSLLRNEKVDFSIAEGFYHDPQKVVERIKANKDLTILLPHDAKPITELIHKTPTLIFCASNDIVTTTEDAKAFAILNEAQVIQFDGDHLGGMNVLTKTEYADEYMDIIMDFLDRNGV